MLVTNPLLELRNAGVAAGLRPVHVTAPGGFRERVLNKTAFFKEIRE